MRAKMMAITKTETGAGEHRQVQVQLTAVIGPENEEWARYTPAGQLSITLKGDLGDRFEIGKNYFLDVSAAETDED